MSGQFTFLLTLFCTSDSSLMKFVVIMSSDEFNSCGVDMDDADIHCQITVNEFCIYEDGLSEWDHSNGDVIGWQPLPAPMIVKEQ